MASKVLRELTIKLDSDLAELKKGLATANKQLGGFQKKINGMGKLLKQAFSVAAVIAVGHQVKEMVGEMSMLGKELEGVRAGFAGIDPAVLNDMRKATHGTVTDLELMKQAVQFKNFGLPVEKLGTMLEFVHRRARTSGQSVKYLADSLVVGLGRKSAMIIDNLGISTSQLNAELKKTPDFTEAVAEIMKRDMLASGDYIETAADITERWAAQWENTKAKVGLFINKGIKLIAPVIDKLRKDMSAMFKETARDLFDFINEWIILYNHSLVFRAVIVGLKTAFKIMWINFKTAIKLMIESIKGFGKILRFVLNPKNWGKGFKDGIVEIIEEGLVAAKNDAFEAGNDLAKTFNDGVRQINEGKQKMLVWDNMFNTDVEAENAKKSGEKLGDELVKGIKKKVKEGMAAWKLPSPRVDFEADTASTKDAVDGIKDVTLELSSVNNFLANSFSLLGESIGEGLSNIEGFTQKFMTILLDFASQFGKIMIGLGTAALTLESLGINPVAAIIAGVALVALSKAARSLIKKGPDFAGGGIIPGNSFSHDRVPIMAKSGEMMLNNRQQSNMFRQINRGGGGLGRNGQLVAKVVVQGSDLLFIFEEAKRQNENSF